MIDTVRNTGTPTSNASQPSANHAPLHIGANWYVLEKQLLDVPLFTHVHALSIMQSSHISDVSSHFSQRTFRSHLIQRVWRLASPSTPGLTPWSPTVSPADTHNNIIYIIKEKLETLFGMESYLPTSDRHAASWIFSDGPSKPLGVVKLGYNALKLFFYNVAILRQRACFRQPTCLFPPATPDTEHWAPHFVAD